MKKFPAILFCCLAYLPLCAQQSAEQQQAITLKRIIERNHYSPRAVNDSFSNDVFTKVFRALDRSGYLFTADEFRRLSASRYGIDEELSGGAWTFVPALTPVYQNALRRADSIVNALLNKPLDLTVDEQGIIGKDTGFRFAATPAELRAHWLRRFKWELLNDAWEGASAQAGKPSLKEYLTKNEAALRQKMKRSSLASLRKFSTPEAVAAHVKEEYLTAVSTSFDPHTQFLSPNEMEEFQSMLSTENKSFGFLVNDKEGKVLVSALVPGGAAWKSGQVHRNDQLLQLTFDGKEPIDATTLSAEEISELLEESGKQFLTLNLRTTDGNMRTLSLRKEKVETEDNSVKGYMLQGAKKIGYLSLPDFYTSWNDESGRGCANDVAREVINLKKEGIEGLVLDLRFNGGGSMSEAQQLTGIFIDEGPLFGVRERGGKLNYLKDPNRSTIWDGPMIVLVNGQSASASEVLAATLQDYHRAIIVGSNTFGKATMQVILPMDSTASRSNAPSPLGFVKITTGKLYRLTGATNQLLGVHPDIVLPDAYDALDYREKSYPNSLLADSVKANSWYKALPELSVSSLQAASKARIGSSASFRRVQLLIARYAALYQDKRRSVPLKIDLYEKWRQQNAPATSTNDEKASIAYIVANHKGETQRLQGNAYAAEINKHVLENMKDDPYVDEAYRIVLDLIQKTTAK